MDRSALVGEQRIEGRIPEAIARCLDAEARKMTLERLDNVREIGILERVIARDHQLSRTSRARSLQRTDQLTPVRSRRSLRLFRVDAEDALKVAAGREIQHDLPGEHPNQLLRRADRQRDCPRLHGVLTPAWRWRRGWGIVISGG